MKRIVNIAKSYEEAQEWDIKQVLAMSPEERQKVAATLKRRVFGSNNPDVRDGHKTLKL